MNKHCTYTTIILIISLLQLGCNENNPTASTTTTEDTPAALTDDAVVANDTIATSTVEVAASLSDYITTFDSTMYAFRDGAVDLNWQILAMVSFDEQYNEELDQYIPYPIFSPTVRALDGKEIYIQGYYIPVDESGDADIIVLSAFPFSACFFCGNAGPESVMDIQLKKKTKLGFKTDDRITFKGKLKLNDSDLYYLNYILEEAELVKE